MTDIYILNKDLSVPNEIVHRKTKDDRREVKKSKNANDIIYLGTKNNFTKNISSFIETSTIEELYLKFLQSKDKGHAMQLGEGILVEHNINIKELEELIPIIDIYFNIYKALYRNPNFEIEKVQNQLQDYLKESKTIKFYSDLVFISDNPPKPYFKWFRDLNGNENNNFEFIKEFLIPKITRWNFKVISFKNKILKISWVLSNSELIDIVKDSKYKKQYQTIETFFINEVLANLSRLNKKDIETFKDAIIKIRVGQSKFRKDLLYSQKNKCIFTGIEKPKTLLIASHIKPWKDSSDKEKIDINNGLLLTPTFDKLFDKFLITFDEKGKVVFSSNINKSTWENLFPKLNDIKNVKIDINKQNSEYLKFHRTKFKDLEK